jgi:predicted ribosome quality control (RQC) complex YloA/Tae2 family protein
MDAIMLALWVEEIRPALVGHRVRDLGTRGAWRVSLRVDREEILSVSLERFFPTLFLEAPVGRHTGGLPGPMAQGLLGRTLDAVQVITGERVVELVNRSGRLIVELLPTRPSLVWCDPDGVVVAVHGHGVDDPRLRAGVLYAPPPAPPGMDAPGADRRLSGELGGGAFPDLLSSARDAVQNGVHALLRGGRGMVSPGTLDGFEVVGVEPTINEAARRAFLAAARHERETREARELQSSIKSLHRRLDRAAAGCRQDLERAASWPTWERFGSTLYAHPHLVPARASEVTLPDVFDPDGPRLSVPLDPTLGATANAASYVKRAERGKRAIPVIERRLATLEEDLAWIDARREQDLDVWTDLDRRQLDALLARHRVRSASGGRETKRKRQESSGEKYHPRRYRSRDGWTILVGRSNAENDWLTHRLARPDDVWLHAQGVPGSHVVIRREGRKDNPSRGTLEEAAALAAAFSKARHSGSVPVIYTEIKYVYKPRKAAPGLAVCTREKTLMVAPADLDDATYADEEDT